MLGLEAVTLTQGAFSIAADLVVEPGRRVALIGPSGAGKSTLLSAIAGFLPCQAGRITWAGRDISGLAPGDRPLSILFQDNNLFPHLTAAQNVGLGLRPNLRLTAAEHAQVQEALTRVGLSGFEARKPADLSGGQQSRVALARVLLRARDLILLDEPFAALGPGLKSEMLGLVAELTAGSTVLMVTHDPQDAQAFADQTILMVQGRAAPPQDTVRLFSNPPPALQSYLAGDASKTAHQPGQN